MQVIYSNIRVIWTKNHDCQYVNLALLENKRAVYVKQILSSLTTKLVAKYGKNFVERNIYRLTLFAERFSNLEI